jgi:hypothetical protein
VKPLRVFAAYTMTLFMQLKPLGAAAAPNSEFRTRHSVRRLAVRFGSARPLPSRQTARRFLAYASGYLTSLEDTRQKAARK